MSKFAILLNGPLEITSRVKRQIAGAKVVAADGGIAHAKELAVTPMCWIGDFDSADSALQARWKDVPRQVFPADKDDTDGALAIDFAIKNGATGILLVGALGGRTDQVLAHLALMLNLAEGGVGCSATSGREEAWPLGSDELVLEVPKGTTISLVGLSDLQGVNLKGVKWPLSGETIKFGSSLGISNVAEGLVTIAVGSGRGVVLVNYK
jgi:thiamine pyrophosphokinase